jgi:hypothetical protein
VITFFLTPPANIPSSDAPAKLKKDLDRLIAIQGDLDRIELTIKEATKALGAGPQTLSPLKDLTLVYDELSNKLDALIASLNITDSFPSLRDLPFEAVHKLLLARDLKINIRKRAIGSFFENERLEQASGGRNQALGECNPGHNILRVIDRIAGTKEHQRVRTAIEKRKSPFLSAIRRFNKLCAELKELIKPDWKIPVPEPLPTDIHKLRTQSHIMEDVWIERNLEKTPRWIESPEVRQGIRAMLSLDRCREERLRLGTEADNMCRWFGTELSQTEIAIADPKSVYIDLTTVFPTINTAQNSDAHIQRHLDAYRTRLLLIEPKWSNSPLVSKLRYQHHITAAKEHARLASGLSQWDQQMVWLPVVEHDPKSIDFQRAVFAEDQSDGVSDEHCQTDPDAADLPDAEEYHLQDLLMEQAAAEEDGIEEQGQRLGRVYWTPPVS